MLQPLATVESPGKNDAADSPVCEHSDPDAHRSEAHDIGSEITQRQNLHSPHRTRQDVIMENFTSPAARSPYPGTNAMRPYKRFHDRDPDHHMETHICTFCFHASKDL